MSNGQPDFEFTAGQGDDEPGDPDTEFILDYLSNKLASGDVKQLEDRARRDKDFRQKLADIVLLKGLVMLALQKGTASLRRECRRARRIFKPYREGTASPAETARLSRHIEECFDCEIAFQQVESDGAGGEPSAWSSFVGRASGFRRRILAATIAALALLGAAWAAARFLA